MEVEHIEKFFLNSLLRIIIAGLILILAANVLFYPEDLLSIYISIAILIASTTSYLIRQKRPTFAVLIVCTVALAAMSYQRLTLPATSTTLSVLLIIGFIFSVMLSGKIMWVMHSISFIILNTIFVIHVEDAITAAITYSTMYFILTYATGILKFNYDKINQHLKNTNLELYQKANKIEVQNEELLSIQDNLSTLNKDLERLVSQRTEKIRLQNAALIKYSFSNAHHLRGPVARLLGLAHVHDLEQNSQPELIIKKMADQAHEIDKVIKQINDDLESGNVDLKP